MKNPLNPACLMSSADNASCAPGSTSGFSVFASSRMVDDFTGRIPVGKLNCASEYSSPSPPSQLRPWPVRNRLDSGAPTHHDVQTTKHFCTATLLQDESATLRLYQSRDARPGVS